MQRCVCFVGVGNEVSCSAVYGPHWLVLLGEASEISRVQGSRTDNRVAVLLLRRRVCFVLDQLWLLRWCAHEARVETEEGHFESRVPTGWYFEVRQVCFLYAGVKY